jgi:hypothetical protein
MNLSTREAAEYLGNRVQGRPWSVGHLANLRYKEQGPAYLVIRGRVRYEQAALDAWLEAETERLSA